MMTGSPKWTLETVQLLVLLVALLPMVAVRAEVPSSGPRARADNAINGDGEYTRLSRGFIRVPKLTLMPLSTYWWLEVFVW